MKTSRPPRFSSVGLIVSGLFAATAIAGPGLDYWRNADKIGNSPAPAAPLEHSLRPCTDARVVSVTETKMILANGRGPTRTVEVGKKLVCNSCDTPLLVMKPSGQNGRGPMEPVAIKGTHDCTKNGCTPAATVTSSN